MVKDGKTRKPSEIARKLEEPRSYLLTDGRRRSSRHLMRVPDHESSLQDHDVRPESHMAEQEEEDDDPSSKPAKVPENVMITSDSANKPNADNLRQFTRCRQPVDRYGY